MPVNAKKTKTNICGWICVVALFINALFVQV